MLKTLNDAMHGQAHLFIGGEPRACAANDPEFLRKAFNNPSIRQRTEQIYEAVLPGVFRDDRVPTEEQLEDMADGFGAMIDNRARGRKGSIRYSLGRLGIISKDEAIMSQQGLDKLREIFQYLRFNNFLKNLSLPSDGDSGFDRLLELFGARGK